MYLYKTLSPYIRAAFLGASVTLGTASSAAADDLSFGITIGGLTDDFLARSEQYSTLGFNGASLTSSFEYKRLSASVTAASTIDGPNKTLSSYDLSLRLGNGNWQVGAGKIDRHWSPSKYTSLIMSKNAAAFHSAYLRKSEATKTDLPVLRWLGAWDGEFFFGTTEDAGQPDGSLIMGMRARIRPVANLEIDFVRTAQWGGEGKPQSLRTFFDVLSGDTNEGDASSANQLAGVGISYTLPKLARGTRVYAQAVGEDEAGRLPSCLFYVAGVEMDLSLFGVPSQITLEHTDTRVDHTENGFCGPNTAYRNGIYSYAQNGVSLGAAIDSESASASLRVKHELQDMTVNWSIGNYQINDASSGNHRLSSGRVQGVLVTAGFSREMFGGTVSAVVAHQGFELDKAGLREGARIGLGFSKSF